MFLVAKYAVFSMTFLWDDNKYNNHKYIEMKYKIILQYLLYILTYILLLITIKKHTFLYTIYILTRITFFSAWQRIWWLEMNFIVDVIRATRRRNIVTDYHKTNTLWQNKYYVTASIYKLTGRLIHLIQSWGSSK